MPDVDITQVLEMSPVVMRDWAMRVSQGSEITELQLRNEILPDGTELGPNGQLWARRKPGSHRTVTVHCGERVYTQTFIKRDDGWSEVKEAYMGWTIESSSNPAFHIGEQVLVSGVIGLSERWEKPLRGTIIGLALETAFAPGNIPEGLTSPWQYHLVLEDETHVYSIENQLERISTLKDKEIT